MRYHFLPLLLGVLGACHSEPPKQATTPAAGVPQTDTLLARPAPTAGPAAPAPNAAGSDSVEWQRIAALPGYNREDQKERYQDYDFSGLWQLHENQPLGFIGPRYERLRIVLLEVRQDERAPALYHVKGKSKVKNAVCAFVGTIRLRHVFLQKDPSSELGPEEKAYVRQRGMAVADYELREERGATHTGVFSGVLTSFWLLTGDEHIRYDDLEAGADGYSNNQFEGQWRSYDGKLRYKANWGDDRIPDSGPLDVGTGEFGPDEAYARYGWQSYLVALNHPHIANGDSLWAIDRAQWW